MSGHREPVHFELRHVPILGPGQQFAHSAIERAQFGFVERVVQTQHGGAMRNFDEAFARLAAHALGRRLGRSELGVALFEVA